MQAFEALIEQHLTDTKAQSIGHEANLREVLPTSCSSKVNAFDPFVKRLRYVSAGSAQAGRC